jgi:hypothetical protein
VSAEAYLAVRCDHRGPDGVRCDTEWGHPTRVDTHRELRRHLRGSGWRRTRDGRDLCPDHAPA